MKQDRESAKTEVLRERLKDSLLQSSDYRYLHRLHCVLLVNNGLDSEQVAECFDENSRSIERWVEQFKQQGEEGLLDEKRCGRPSTLDAETLVALGRAIRRHPREFGFFKERWDSHLLQHHLQSRYHIKLGLRQCQRVFNKLKSGG
ncbi:MAG: helix-turn-helix domain containing protein [gamma proteobacterium endosymbiont of Lamellibrachia anaximandri]|nr:helix-turn-helix domain containing protein [gamma proteobacterium endosymbiont of Lamellibrachia anaximandri]MBL3533516.1 helix-turn-helix domain containing protein [gamma proteobacterium endosymbiont of Lamellibrachia anaximandri]MBL3599446.1 helix-turn-helix domain containing protein [gamma proteobacterium endosymbiont of Lamellibrachia anaximandri]